MNTAIETAPLSRPVAQPEPRPTFAGSVRGEVLKLRRQRGTWAMLGLALLLYLLVTAALFGAAPFKRTLASSPTQFLSNLYDIYLTIFNTGAGIFLLLLSARLVGMEYSGGTIRVLLARGTGRLRLLGAKLTALALVAVGLLAGFLALTSATVYLVVVAWAGSFRPLASLPGHLWHDLATEIVVALVSMAAAILIGATASVVGRSVAFGIGAALALYPFDNLLVILMRLLSTVTNQHLWLDLTGYLLGPNLSNLPAVLETDRAARVAFAAPMVKVDPTHAWLVIGAWLLAFLVLSVGLTWRRDVMQ